MMAAAVGLTEDEALGSQEQPLPAMDDQIASIRSIRYHIRDLYNTVTEVLGYL